MSKKDSTSMPVTRNYDQIVNMLEIAEIEFTHLPISTLSVSLELVDSPVTFVFGSDGELTGVKVVSN